MPKLGDSRDPLGPGIIPAQDHRSDIDLDARSAHVACRIIDTRTEPTFRHIEEEDLHGDVQGLCPWGLDDRGSTSPRQCVMWRHAWPATVLPAGDALIDDPAPPDSFPTFPGDAGPSTPSGVNGSGWSSDSQGGSANGRTYRDANGRWTYQVV